MDIAVEEAAEDATAQDCLSILENASSTYLITTRVGYVVNGAIAPKKPAS